MLACWFGVDRSTITRAIGEVRPLLAQRGCTVAPGIRLGSLTEVVEFLRVGGRTGIIDGTEIRVRRPAVGRKDRHKFVSGKSKQNAVKTMVLTDAGGRVLFCSPVRPGSCADITQARQLGLVQLLADGPFMESSRMPAIRAWAPRPADGVVTPPHRKFKKNPPSWYEERHEQLRKAHSSRRIRAEHGIAHLKNWRALARHLGRREHMSDIVQAVARLLSHQQTTTLYRSLRVTRPAQQPSTYHGQPCTRSLGLDHVQGRHPSGVGAYRVGRGTVTCGVREEAGGQGGDVPVRRLADKVGLTDALGEALVRRGFHPVHDRGTVLVSATCAVLLGARSIAGIDVMRQTRLVLGRPASASTLWRTLDAIGPVQLTKIASARARVRGHVHQLLDLRPEGFPWIKVKAVSCVASPSWTWALR
ncbi:transposase family protein [Streptomyces sp. NPDC002285]